LIPVSKARLNYLFGQGTAQKLGIKYPILGIFLLKGNDIFETLVNFNLLQYEK